MELKIVRKDLESEKLPFNTEMILIGLKLLAQLELNLVQGKMI